MKTVISRNCNSGDLNLCHTQCRDTSGMESESWSSVVSGSESARPKTQEQKWTHFWFVAAEGPSPNKVRPNVWTRLKEQREHGEDPWTTQDPWNKTQVRCSEEARTRGRAEWKGERDAEIKEQIVLRVGHAGSWRTNREEIIQTTVCIRNDSATRDSERQARVGSNNEPTGTRTKREGQEPGVTHHRESEEDREQDESNARSHPD